jgi:hypothetical protein
MKKQDLQESFQPDSGLTVNFLTAFLQKMTAYGE